MTAVAHSCPSCHSMGSPRVVDRTLSGPMYCRDPWHTAVRQSDTAVRQSDTDAPTTTPVPRLEHREAEPVVPEGVLDLDALKALCEKATPGPWSAGGDFIHPHELVLTPDRPFLEFDNTDQGRADAAFAAAARTAVPALLAEVERVTTQATQWMHEATRQAGERDANYAQLMEALAEVERLRVADCGHDLEAFDRQARELAQARRRECSALCRDIEHDRDVFAAEVERLRAKLARVPAETALIVAERDQARAALDRVRALHQQHEGWCTYCHEYCDCLDRVQDLDNAAQVARAAWDCTHRAIPWPCPTIAALTASPTEGGGRD